MNRTTAKAPDPSKPYRQIPKSADIKREVDALSRDPFRNVLADILACAPDPAAIRKHAKKSPDRWAQMLSIVARLGGYHEKLEVDTTLSPRQMSDAEINQRIQQLLADDAAPAPRHTASQADGRDTSNSQPVDSKADSPGTNMA